MPDYLQKHLAELGTPRRLLLIDDDPLDCDAIRRNTNGFNCDLFVAGSIEAAMQTLSGKDSNTYFATIIMDLCMPTSAHGIAMVKLLSERYPKVPVVVLSGKLDSTSIHKINSIRCVFFVEKPISYNEDFFEQMFAFMGIPRRIPSEPK